MSPAAQVAEAVVGLAAVTAVAAGILLRRPPHRAAWLLLGAGLLAFAVGDLLALAVPARDHAGPVDLVYLAGYPLLIAGLALMHRRGERARDGAVLVDAAILALTAAVGYWVLLVGPGFGAQTGADQLLAVAYLVLDVALLGVAIRLVVAGPTRPVATLLALAVAAVLVTDSVYQTGSLGERAALTLPLHLGWLLGMALVAAAATHADARQPVAVPESRRETLSPVRLALLASVVLIPPALIGLQAARGRYGDIAILSIALGAVLALVVTRVGLLMRDVGRTAARERTLRTAAADFVAAGDRSRIHAAALRAVDLLAPGLVASRIVDVAADEEVEVVAGGGRHDARVRGRALASSLLPYVGAGTAFRDVLVEELDVDLRDGLGLREAQGQLRVFPVRVHRELLAVIVLVTTTPLEAGTTHAVETLVAQLALALESATLADDLHVRQSEARFRALVQNSSDAILLVDKDASRDLPEPVGRPDVRLSGRRAGRSQRRGPVPSRRPAAGAVGPHRRAVQPGATRRLELRLRRRGGGWLDAEAVVNNLQADPNVRASVVTVRDVSERKQFETQLTHQAFHDELTGLANRALFTDRVAHALARRERDGTTLAVLLLDLDDFKTVNDGLGHAAGDSMLRAVAERLAALVRPGDTTARLGGDEFAMVLVDLPSEPAAVHAVERIITVLGEPLVIEGKEVFVQASIGLAFADDPADAAATPEQLLRNADVAMYVVKTDGKGRYAIFEPHMHAAALHRLDLRAGPAARAARPRVRSALPADRVDWRPADSSVSRRWCAGSTRSAAWCRRTRSSRLPRRPVSSCPLGLWVLEQACRQVADWSTGSQRSVGEHQRVAAPAAPRRVRRRGGRRARPHRHRPVAARPRDHRERRSWPRSSPPSTRLRALKELGVRVAVDDFGTGYSSFSWLRQLPVDVLKIDKAFVDELGRREQGGFLVEAIIDLAHNLGLRTVAEGIERPTQLARLRDMHCDLGQGFHVGKPMPAEDVVDLLAMEKGKHRSHSSGSAWAS